MNPIVLSILAILPELIQLVIQAIEAVMAVSAGKPADELEREITEAVMAGYRALDAGLKLPDVLDAAVAMAVPGLVKLVLAALKQAPSA